MAAIDNGGGRWTRRDGGITENETNEFPFAGWRSMKRVSGDLTWSRTLT